MQVCDSGCLLPLMTSHICLLILSGLTVSSQLGLEDVFFSPQDQTVSEGEAVFLQCVSGESSPPANITWLKDGHVVTKGKQIQGEYGGGHQKKTSATLHLLNVSLEDDGIYVCVTRNALMNFSKKSDPAKLTVQGVPRRLQIIQGPDNITVAVGTEVSMHCAVRGFPVPMVHWFKDGCVLTNCSASFSLQNNGQLLTFRNVTREDEGSYHCEASNKEETIKSPPAFLHAAEMDWSFVQQPVNVTAKRGDNVTVICRPPSSRPAALVSWFRNNQLLSLTAHTAVLPSGDLFFHGVQEEDSGTYFCRASNIHLQRFLTSHTATLTVLAPPAVKLWPQTVTVAVGARVVLECRVSGYPSPSITWVKRGHSKQTGGKITSGARNATLCIQSARSYDEGVYVCEASNSLGQSRSTALLRVAVSPVIVTFVGQVNCRLQASVVLPCRAMGIQPITYTWTRAHAQSPLIPTEDRVIAEDGALHISSVQHSDAGEYYCTAENRAGRHQRRAVLTVADPPSDRIKQRGVVVSPSSNVNSGPPGSQISHSMAEQHLKRERPHAQAQAQRSTLIKATSFPQFSGKGFAELRMPSGSLSHALLHRTNQPTTSPTQPLITQMQPPILPPPPHPNFQSVDLYSGLALTTHPLFISNSQPPVTHSPRSAITGEDLSTTLQPTESPSHLTQASLGLPTRQQINEKSFTEAGSLTEMSESSSTLPVDGPLSPVSNTLMGHSVLHTSQDESYISKVTESSPPPSDHDRSLIQIPPTQEAHLLPFAPSSQASQIHSQQSFTLNLIPKFHLEFSTTQHHLPFMKPTKPSITKPQPTKDHRLLSPTYSTSALPQTRQASSPAQNSRLSFPTTLSPDETSTSSTLTSEMTRQVNGSDHPIQSDESSNDTELTDWLKRNTSQSPMTSNDPRVTQQSPSWLPVLEKHDIPIVVGVGVSLAFIFITVTFYSVVQKNEPAPTSRAAQRHLGVPKRHAERWTAGRTYENRAFEDDECVAVIEQSPNTSDTRARPPGPSLVTVQMEPTTEDPHEEIQPALDNHSVTVETYPEPIADTKIDPSLDEEKGCTLSQPSIQLHCAEDWGSGRGDDRSPCHDTLPPPSSFPSRSPSPSPPSRREEGLHSSLTLHSAEPCVAPIHHSLSISRGNPPLLLSHHVSMGLTTVAVDVHFYPAATASMAVGSSTHISSVSNSTSMTAPLFSPPLVNIQENDQSTAKFQSSK